MDEFEISHLAIHACERTWHWKPQPFADFDLWVVLEGAGVLTVNGIEHPLESGKGFLLQPGDTVEGRHDPDDPLIVLACHLKPGNFSKLPQEGRLSKEVLHFKTEDVGPFRRRAEKAIRWDQERGVESVFAKLLVAEMVVRALLLCGGHPILSTPTALSRLASQIRSRPGEDWPVQQMARQCSLSVPQFSRKFRQAFGESPRQFVIRQRVLRAIHLLRESELTIAEIAESLGYRDHFFFHRQFKAVAGVTPTDARRGQVGLVNPTAAAIR